MAFWGIEVKPGKPYIHRYDNERGRLHISQATLGSGSSTKKSKVQCNVGDKSPIYLCSLLPERLETCALNLEFEEEDEVTFSVIGPHRVHLSGFFYGENDQDKVGDDSGSDSYEENIVGTDSEDEDDFMNYDSEDEDEDEEHDFIDDDDDLGIYRPSPVPNSGVRIEEIVDDEKPVNENGVSKRAKKKKSQSNVSDDNVNSDRQLVVNGGHDVHVLESEDDDGFPVSASREIKDDNADEEGLQKKPKTEVTKKLKRKIDAVGGDGEHARENDTPHGPSDPTDKVSQNDAKTKKKNKKKKVTKEAQQAVLADSNDAEQLPMAEMDKDLKATSEKKKEKKKKNNQNKTEEIASNTNADQSIKDKNGSALEKEEKQEAKPLQVRTYPNGLAIEELAMGKPDGKRASPGKKVSVHYIGKLKNNGKIFDSNVGRAPFKFRLGIGQVIKGWDVGVNGMRIGDKRRLTIPPAMGYGAKGAGGTILPNSWLVFDVELVDVN